jgi:uncharacterized protein (DUF58 family)
MARTDAWWLRIRTAAMKLARRAAWSFARPRRRLRFTREGKVFIGITLGVGFAAVNTGNNLLYLVLGLLLSLVILSGVLSEVALWGLEFRRRLPRRAYAGTPALVEIEVHNRKRYAPSYSIEVEDRLDNRRTDKRCYFLKVSAGARQTAAYRRVAPVRGTEHYVALRVATRFPFGLFEKWREVEMRESQLVYPSPLRSRGHRTPTVVAGEQVTREERGHGEVDGVRELSDGDPVRDIHWAKTAATGRLVARERRREGARAVRIEVANRPGEGAADEPGRRAAMQRVEEEIRRAAGAALDALKGGAAVHLVAQVAPFEGVGAMQARPSSGAADRVLSFLARLPPEPELPGDPALDGRRKTTTP